MKPILSTFIAVMLSLGSLKAQPNLKNQFFDGADTSAGNSLFITPDTAAGNIWQVGAPQKVVFNSAATNPNVLVTDTVTTYPPNNKSSFTIGYRTVYQIFPVSVMAIRWKQKLDLDAKEDGAFVEFSIDTGKSWLNAFSDPLTYNFYGFNASNVDTVGGSVAFTGTDTVWRDIWLCFRGFTLPDSFMVRYTLTSDSIDNQRDGWMIDNFMAYNTVYHTIAQTELSNYFKLYPTLTTGSIFIEALQSGTLRHRVERVDLINAAGYVVERFRAGQDGFSINISKHPPGAYHVRVFSDQKSKTFSVILGNN